MYYVYVIFSLSHKTRYIGSTSDLGKRLLDHNTGKSRYTSGRMPWKLIHKESFDSRKEALKREKFLKSGKGREFLDEILINS